MIMRESHLVLFRVEGPYAADSATGGTNDGRDGTGHSGLVSGPRGRIQVSRASVLEMQGFANS